MERETPHSKEVLFQELFERNYAKLYYLAVSIVDDEDDAHDIVGEFFASMWEQYEAGQEYNSSYLYRGVQRKCLDYLKHVRVKDRYRQYTLSHNSPLLPDDDTEDERLAKVERVIAEMPERTRFVVDQCYMQGKKYVEVAEMLHISRDGVRKHITKALRMLRAAFSAGA